MSLQPLAQFGDGALLVFLLAAVAAGALSLWLLRWRAQQAARLLGHGGGRVLIDSAPGRSLAKLGLIAGVVLLLAIAIARPQIGERTRELEQQGVAMVVALDVSLSMAAEDAEPNRMQAAQAELWGLLERMSGDRVGVVIFAGEALVRFPLTRDLVTAAEIIDAMLPGERLLPPGTDIAAAIERSLGLLTGSEARTKVILLVGDGESLSGDALAAAAAAATSGVRIFTAGVGSEAGVTIPVRNRVTLATVPKIDARTGEPVITRLDAQALTTLAALGDGRFLRLDRPGALSDLAADLAALDASSFRVTTERRPVERLQIPLAIALGLLLMEPLIAARAAGARKRARRRLIFLGMLPIVAMVAAACGNPAAERNADGNEAYAEGRFADAAIAYTEALAEDPDDARLALNLGRALHALGDYDAASSATSRALRTTDDALAARAYFNLGNHRFQQADLIAARNAYIEALLLDPTDTDAKINLEVVNRLTAAATPAPAPGSGDAAGGDGEAAESAQGSQSEGGGASEGASGAGAPGGGSDDETPTNTAPGRAAGRAPVPGEGSAPLAARETAEQLQAALDELDRDNPTAEQALAILDALRLRDQATGSGSGILGVEVSGVDDY